MGRKKKVKKGRFIRVYRTAESAEQLAGSLGISIATVYNKLREYGLEPIIKHPRRRYSDEEFVKVHRELREVRLIAKQLGVTERTVRNHLHRLSLPTGSGRGDRKTMGNHAAAAREYRGRTTITDLARKYDVSVPKMRYWLSQTAPKLASSYNLPLPQKLRQLKILNELSEREELYDDAELLADVVGLSLECVQEYLESVFRYHQKSASAG